MKHEYRDAETNEQISAYYDSNIEIAETNKKKAKYCNNPECASITYLKKGEIPMVLLGKVCWNCKSDKFLNNND